MSIIRIGLAETKNFSEGYDLIFGKKEAQEQPAAEQQQDAKKPEETKKKKNDKESK